MRILTYFLPDSYVFLTDEDESDGYLPRPLVTLQSGRGAGGVCGGAATLIAQIAIQSAAPFGQWASEMISDLKDEETVTIEFRYR